MMIRPVRCDFSIRLTGGLAQLRWQEVWNAVLYRIALGALSAGQIALNDLVPVLFLDRELERVLVDRASQNLDQVFAHAVADCTAMTRARQTDCRRYNEATMSGEVKRIPLDRRV